MTYSLIIHCSFSSHFLLSHACVCACVCERQTDMHMYMDEYETESQNECVSACCCYEKDAQDVTDSYLRQIQETLVSLSCLPQSNTACCSVLQCVTFCCSVLRSIRAFMRATLIFHITRSCVRCIKGWHPPGKMSSGNGGVSPINYLKIA